MTKPADPRLRDEALQLPAYDLTLEQTFDLELLLNGAFSPLAGYLTKADHDSVLRTMRLADGTLWPLPVQLDVDGAWLAANGVGPGSRIALRHPEGMPLAVLHVSDAWEPDLVAEADAVYGTHDATHPGVAQLMSARGRWYLGGRVEGIELPPHHTYPQYRFTPDQLKAEFARRGWTKVVGFQTRNPMHRAHVEIVRRAARSVGAKVLLHPAVGRTRSGDLDYFVRARCYEAALRHMDPGSTMLAFLPLAMRMAGPREALLHAIVRRNHGCTHFIVGRDHAGAPAASGPIHGPFEAQELVRRHAGEIGIEVVATDEVVYVPSLEAHVPRNEVPAGAAVLSLSGTELRQRLQAGDDLPAWFTYPEVAEALRRLHPPRSRQGFTVFFTGLPSSGKTTLANVLAAKLMEDGTRPITLLDGDVVRKNLSKGLGFSKEDRDTNIRRIGFVAAEVARNGGAVLCAAIAPYDQARKEVRAMCSAAGGFVLVHVATDPRVCEERDRKGLWTQARQGRLKGFTGVDDPYEAPADADLVLDAGELAPEAAVRRIVAHLASQGYLAGDR